MNQVKVFLRESNKQIDAFINFDVSFQSDKIFLFRLVVFFRFIYIEKWSILFAISRMAVFFLLFFFTFEYAENLFVGPLWRAIVLQSANDGICHQSHIVFFELFFLSHSNREETRFDH